MIQVSQLQKQFLQMTKPKFSFAKAKREMVMAVEDISFSASDGAILGLLGANGAGKTTSLRMVAGLLQADKGEIVIDGESVSNTDSAGRPNRPSADNTNKASDHFGQPNQMQTRMGVLSDARGLYPRLTARENIHYYGALHGMSEAYITQRCDLLSHWLDMKALLERRTEGFSQGERMKVALARALIHDPKNIILDEPTNGLDVVATRNLREFLRWLCSVQGGSKCIVFSSHIMQEVERLCDSVVIVAGERRLPQVA